MRRILLTIISLLPLLSYGQSMKIAPKQIEAGANGNVIITRNGINTLDNIDWTDINNIPNNLEHTANKINSLPLSNLDATHYISGKAIDEWGFIWRGAFSGSALDVDNAYRSGYYILSGTPSGTLPSNYNSSLSSSLQIYNQGITSSNYQYQVLTQTDGTSWWRMANYQSSWSDWQQYASQDWVNNNFLTSETDPIYTADNENIMIRRDDLSSSENLNDVLVSGVYFQLVNNNATTALNYPLAGQGGVLEVFKGSDNRAMQRFTARPTSSTPITFVRRMYANAWSDWVQLANIDDIPDVNNGTLTINTSGIATGSTTFSANQSNNSSVTVNVPGTNLGGNFSLLNSKINVTSSTGTNASIDVPFAFDDAGYMTTTGNEGFNTGGGFSTNITKITTNSSSHLINSNDYTIIVAAENCTLNIPSPLDCTGRFIRIVYQSASPTKVTLGINQPQDLTGSPIAQMNNAGALLIQSDGTNWIQVNNYSN